MFSFRKIPQPLYYGLGIALSNGISFLMLPVYTHYLSADAYGRLEILVTFANLLSITLLFGLVDCLYRYSGAGENEQCKKDNVAHFMTLSLIVCISSTVLFQWYASSIASMLPGDIVESDLRLIMYSLSAGSPIALGMAWLRVNQLASTFFFLSALKVSVQVGMSLLLLVNEWGLTSILMSGAISSAVTLILILFIVHRKTGLILSHPRFWEFIRYALPFVASGAAMFAMSGADRWFIPVYLDETTLGTFAVAAKFALIPSILIQPFTLWWHPRRFQLLTNRQELNQNVFWTGIGVALIISCSGFIGLLSPMLITYLTPEAYHDAIALVPWLLIGATLKLVAEQINLGCLINKSSVAQMNINIFCAALTLISLAICVPTYGMTAVITITILVAATRLMLFHHYSQKHLPMSLNKPTLILPSIAAAIMMMGGQNLA